MPDKPPPDYEALETEQWRKNAQAVADELQSGSNRLMTRIRLFVARFGFSKTEVEDKVRTDFMFAAHFAKEPRRTGLHESVAAEWVNSLEMVREFTVLPKGGPNSIYVTGDGNIHRGKLGNRPGKSLDFTWKTGSTTCYAMHKYTKEGGGTQDSQFDEMVTLLRNFQSCNDKSCVLFIIVDGSYYRGKKMDILRGHTRSHAPKSYALPIEELPAILQQYS